MNFDLKSTMLGIAVLVLVVAVLVAAPLATIAALNTVFDLSIAYTFWTWLSIVWLQIISFGSVVSAIGKK